MRNTVHRETTCMLITAINHEPFRVGRGFDSSGDLAPFIEIMSFGESQRVVHPSRDQLQMEIFCGPIDQALTSTVVTPTVTDRIRFRLDAARVANHGPCFGVLGG